MPLGATLTIPGRMTSYNEPMNEAARIPLPPSSCPANAGQLPHAEPFGRMAHLAEYLYDHAAGQPDLAELAAHEGMSVECLQRRFRAWAGIGPEEMLRRISRSRTRQALRTRRNTPDATSDGPLGSSARKNGVLVHIEAMTPDEYRQGARGLLIHYQHADTLLGEALVASTERGLCFLAFVDDDDGASLAEACKQARSDLRAEYPAATLREEVHPLQQQALDALAAMYQPPSDNPLHGLDSNVHQAAHARHVTLHLRGTPFQLKVWRALLDIAPGQLDSYGRIAGDLGMPTGARAVGSAIGSNPVSCFVPCHRVIRESGVLGGYRWGRARKMLLLAHELGAADPQAPDTRASDTDTRTPDTGDVR